jgi:hypothetical protein
LTVRKIPLLRKALNSLSKRFETSRPGLCIESGRGILQRHPKRQTIGDRMKAPKFTLRRSEMSLLVLTFLSSLSLNAGAMGPGGLQCVDFLNGKNHVAKDHVDVDALQDNVDGVYTIPKRDMKIFVESFLNTVERNYGPRTLKMATQSGSHAADMSRVTQKWDLAKKKLLAKLKDVTTETELRYLFADFLFSMNDAHVSLAFDSTLRRTLPMRVEYDLKTEKYFLSYLNRKDMAANIISGELPPPGSMGKAELVAVDGLPALQYQASMPFMNADANVLTNRSLFGQSLFSMSEAAGAPLAKMPRTVELTFRWKQGGTDVLKTVKLKYEETGVGMNDIATIAPPNSPPVESEEKRIQNFKDLLSGKRKKLKQVPQRSIIGQHAELVERLFDTSIHPEEVEESISNIDTEAKRGEGHLSKIGQQKPLFELPDHFVELKLPREITHRFPKDKIFAGTFVRDGKRVGFLRIPSYDVMEPMGAIDMIHYVVGELEKNTDYLILDQMHNPGGSVLYSDLWIYGLTGGFDASKHLSFRVKPTEHFISSFLGLLNEFDQTARFLPRALVKPLLASIRQQFETVQNARVQGLDLSEPISLLPFTEYIQLMSVIQKAEQGKPNLDAAVNVKYTKPIYMLIDQFDFSGGDATPASLQDYGRAKLIGVRTAGAGGTVEEFSTRQLNAQWTYRLTTSLMYRTGNPSQRYIENVGVTPNIYLPMGVGPEGRRNYLNQVLDVINQDQAAQTPR